MTGIGFPRPGSQDQKRGGEHPIILFKENGDICGLLFQFIYAKPQPDLERVAFDKLELLAGAVEAFNVYSPKSICKMYSPFLMRCAGDTVRS